MAARSIASLSLGFGLVSIPVRLYSATESSATIHFNLLAKDGSRVKQQYIAESSGEVVPRAEMVKGYEFEKDRYVVFQPDELKALENNASHLIDIVSFIPVEAVDPIYFDKAYFLAPDKRGGKPYNLLKAAMRESGRCALARWAWKGKQYVVQVRANDEGLVLQQLLYADEVRSLKDLDIEQSTPSPAELKLALQLIEQISADSYEPTEYEDEEKKRILAAIDAKIAGQEVVAMEHPEDRSGGEVIDLTEMLRASLSRASRSSGGTAAPAKRAVKASAEVTSLESAGPAKGAKRAPSSASAKAAAAPKARAAGGSKK